VLTAECQLLLLTPELPISTRYDIINSYLQASAGQQL